MPKSIRWRLQMWYAVVLLAVVGGFAVILYSEIRSARFVDVDTELTATVQFLDASLRWFPPFMLDPDKPDPRGPDRMPPGSEPGLPPRRPNADRLLADLVPPMRDTAGRFYVIWRRDGSVLKSSGVPDNLEFPDLNSPRFTLKPTVVRRGEYREATGVGPQGSRIIAGRQVTRELADLRRLGWQIGGAGAISLLIGLAGGWMISARILRPLDAISKTASAISATNLKKRIDQNQIDRELLDLARVLNAMFDRLQAAFERQVRFTADASHELRTPLAIIRSHAELALSRPRQPEEYREALDACVRATERMTALVEGLLVLARADAGKLDIRRDRVDLARVVEDTLLLLHPVARQKRVTLHAHLAPTILRGDSMRLGQVVTNLANNAIQYNRTGGEVFVDLKKVDDHAVLTVRDTGVGINPSDLRNLFERFYRVDQARARSSGGTGLGLAITKGIVEAHGGTIEVASEENAGTTFTIRLPLKVAI